MRSLFVLLALLLTSFSVSAQAPAGTPAGAFVRPDGTLDLTAAPAGALDLTGLSVTLGAGGALHAVGDYTDISSGPSGPPLSAPVHALAVGLDGTVYAAGEFTTAGLALNFVARRDGASWQPLGEGVNSPVNALAVGSDGSLYAGGEFTMAGGASASRVARWDGTAWSPLGDGVDGTVSTLALAPDGSLYAGGDFTMAGGAPASHIAHWDGSVWSPLGDGVDDDVRALAVHADGSVTAGGDFTMAGGAAASRIAQWDGTTWSALGSGMNNSVHALAVGTDGTLYAGGTFTTAGTTGASRVAQWDGTAWSPLGSGTSGFVHALAVAPDGSVYAGGVYSNAGGQTALSVARWDGSAWSPLGTGTGNNGILGTVFALAFRSDGAVVAGGGFTAALTSAGTVTANNVAQWDGAAWTALGSGVDNTVLALAAGADGSVYAGGAFTTAGTTAANRVARWDGTAWSPLGSGLNDLVYALAVGPDGTLYAAGAFTFAFGGGTVNRVARWDGTAWRPLGSGMDNSVRALAVGPDGTLYAGGTFTTAGGAAASRVARWNGTAWFPLGSGVDNAVLALAVGGDGSLYAGGSFTMAGGVSASRVAQWDGTVWRQLGTGTNNTVNALAVTTDGSVYAGGDFFSAGSVAARYVARWDGSAWRLLGNSVGGPVLALAAGPDGSLTAGGRFSTAGSLVVNRVARWDGAVWSALGSGVGGGSNGLSGNVHALAFDGAGDVVLGGAFTTAGGAASPYVTLYDAPTPAPTAFAFLQPVLADAYRVGGWLKAIWTTTPPGALGPDAPVVLTLRKGGADVVEVYRGPNLTQPDFGAARTLIPTGTPAGTDYSFRVESEEFPAVFAVSDVFAITDPGAAFAVTAPEAGQTLALGAPTTVAWTAPAGAPGGTVEIEVVAKGSGTVAATATTANDGAAEITLPAGPAGRYVVTVTSAENPYYTGRTGGVRLGVVGVTAPTAGAVVDEGDALTVAWQSPTLTDPSATATVGLKRAGQRAVWLATDVANDGTLAATVPTGLMPGADYYVLVRVTDGGATYSAKSGRFTVNGTGTPVASPSPTYLALSPQSFGTREATLTVTGLADGTEVGVYAGRSLVGAGVVAGGVAELDVRGAVVLDRLVTGAVTADDVVEVADGSRLTLVAVRGGVEQVLDVPLAFADGAEVSVTVPGGVGLAPAASLAVSAYPNPTAGATTVTVSAPAGAGVTVTVVDVLGRTVATLLDGAAPAGRTVLSWDARRAAPGVYVVRAVSGTSRATARVTVVR